MTKRSAVKPLRRTIDQDAREARAWVASRLDFEALLADLERGPRR